MTKDDLFSSSKLFKKVFDAELETQSPTCQFEMWDKGSARMKPCGQIALSGRRICADHEDRDVKRSKK